MAIVYLTQQAEMSNDSGRDRPVQIEITSAMIEAGEIAAMWAGEEVSRETVIAVYSAMVVSQRSPKLPARDAAREALRG